MKKDQFHGFVEIHGHRLPRDIQLSISLHQGQNNRIIGKNSL